MATCPYCSSPLVSRSRPYYYSGFYHGRFDFLVCPVCSRTFQPLSTAQSIDTVLRSKGLLPKPMQSATNVTPRFELPRIRIDSELAVTPGLALEGSPAEAAAQTDVRAADEVFSVELAVVASSPPVAVESE